MTSATSSPMELEEYARIAEAEDAHWWYRATRALMGDLLRPWLRPGLAALDAGCGPGGNGAWLSAYGQVVGLDSSPVALELLRRRHPSVEPVQGSVDALPFPDATFDVVLAITVLNQVADDALATREIARVLRPGGVALAFEPALPALRRAHDRVVGARRRYRVRDLAGLVTGAGLEVRRATYCHGYLVPPAAVLAAVDRVRPPSAPRRSDLDRPRLDFVFSTLARAERRLLQRADMPVGTSAAVVGERVSAPA